MDPVPNRGSRRRRPRLPCELLVQVAEDALAMRVTAKHETEKALW
jgi:hypothetical protein